ncbi:MAG: CoA pyrophosphatase, partial [Aeromicrobium sp.]
LKSVKAEHLAPRFPHPPADARMAAVLMLFADGPMGPDLLLTLRASTLRSHAGQIAFPGGMADPGDDGAVATALREAEEEVGLDQAEVQVFGQLPLLWLPPNNFAVTTVLAYWPQPRELQPVDVGEVESVFRAPIAELMDPANRYTVVHPTGWRGPAFDVDSDMPLWGFTAGVVSRLFAEVGWELPWDDSVTRPLPGLL